MRRLSPSESIVSRAGGAASVLKTMTETFCKAWLETRAAHNLFEEVHKRSSDFSRGAPRMMARCAARKSL